MLKETYLLLRLLKKRGKIDKLLFWETMLICFLSLFLFIGKRPEFFGSEYEFPFMIQMKYQPLAVIMILITPIIASLPAAGIIADEDTMQYMLMTRTKRTDYYWSRYIVVLLCGFINIVYIYILLTLFQRLAVSTSGNLYITNGANALQYLFPDHSIPFFSFIWRRPNLFYLILIIFIGMFGAASAVLSFEIGQITGSESLLFVGGFIILLVAGFFCEQVSVAPYYMIFTLQATVQTVIEYVGIGVLWIFGIILTSILMQLFIIYRKNHEE